METRIFWSFTQHSFFTQMMAPTMMTARTTSTRTPPTAPATPRTGKPDLSSGTGKFDATTLSVGRWPHLMSPRLASSTEHLHSTVSYTPWTTMVGSFTFHNLSIGRKSVLFLSDVLMILPWNITFSGLFGSQTNLPSAIYSTVSVHSHESVSCRTICSVTSDNFSRESSCCIWKVEKYTHSTL